MLKLFKSIDDKLAEIGFIKTDDDEYTVRYERRDGVYDFTQVLCILHKSHGRHLVFSYDKDRFDSKNIGNINVGLTGYEMKLILKKMKQKGWFSGKKATMRARNMANDM